MALTQKWWVQLFVHIPDKCDLKDGTWGHGWYWSGGGQGRVGAGWALHCSILRNISHGGDTAGLVQGLGPVCHIGLMAMGPNKHTSSLKLFFTMFSRTQLNIWIFQIATVLKISTRNIQIKKNQNQSQLMHIYGPSRILSKVWEYGRSVDNWKHKGHKE